MGNTLKFNVFNCVPVGHGVAFSAERQVLVMKTEEEKDKHVTFRAPAEIIEAVLKFCQENDEKPSQFWRKAAKLRLAELAESKRPQSLPARAGAGAVKSGERKCRAGDAEHCPVKSRKAS
jgi:hypothetical protein